MFALVASLVVAVPLVQSVVLDRELVLNGLNSKPTQECKKDTCKIVGDPHVTRLDRKWVSLLDADTQNADAKVDSSDGQSPGPGVHDLIKNGEIEIQAKFGLNGNLLISLTVTGSALGGGVLVIYPEKKGADSARPASETVATWNGQPILTSFPSSEDNEFFSAIRDGNVDNVARNERKIFKTNGLTINFKQGEIAAGMSITAIRKERSLNVAVTMCEVHAEWGEKFITTGMCTANDPGTTVEPIGPTMDPQSNPCTSGTCNIFGDPHVTNFEGRWVSFLQGQAEGTGVMAAASGSGHKAIQKPGDFWLVRSAALRVQARFGRNGPMMTHVAVGGDLVGGNVLIVGAKKDIVTLNDNQIVPTFPSAFGSDDGLVFVSYENQTSMVARRGEKSKVVSGVRVSLPRGVNLLVNRLDHSVNAAITMCESVTGAFGGYCGSLDAGMDPMLTEVSADSVYEVAAGDSLFPKKR